MESKNLYEDALEALSSLPDTHGANFLRRRIEIAYRRVRPVYDLPIRELTDKQLMCIRGMGPKSLKLLRQVIPNPQKEFYSEDAEWNKPKNSRSPATFKQSTILLRNLQVGDVKRIVHYDAACRQTKDNRRECTLDRAMSVLRKKSGWVLESYHEADHILVVRRTA